jgi:hypothetical protein
LSGIDQTVSISLSCGDDLANFVIGSDFNSSFFNFRLLTFWSKGFKLNFFMFNQSFEVANDLFGSLSQSFAVPVLLVLNFWEVLALESVSNDDFGFTISLF